MDVFLDRLWSIIQIFLEKAVFFIDTLFSPLEILGPAVVIFCLAFAVVILTRIIKHFYVTKRYIELEQQFYHWKSLRKEALKHSDREKGKRLAKNIDQAQLNKVYYDYFFEGLLKNFVTNVIPILLSAAYVTTVYTPETLTDRFDQKWVFSFSLGASAQVNISSFFWFVICVVLSFIIYAVIKHFFKKKYFAMKIRQNKKGRVLLSIVLAAVMLIPADAFATQRHLSTEGIITHQIGHIFFLFSMVVLIFFIKGKQLDAEKGWRFIQYSAFFFILWNLDAFLVHFFDNQIQAVTIKNISSVKVQIITNNDSPFLAWGYYFLKLDHLLCVPAMLFLYMGFSNLVNAKKQRQIP